MAIANEQKQEGKKDLADFALSRNSNSIKDLIQQTWKMTVFQMTVFHIPITVFQILILTPTIFIWIFLYHMSLFIPLEAYYFCPPLVNDKILNFLNICGQYVIMRSVNFGTV